MSTSSASDGLDASARGEPVQRWRAQALVPRLISGLLLAPVALAAAWFGGWALAAVLTVVLLIAFGEFLRMGSRAGFVMARAPGVAAVLTVLFLGVLPEVPLKGGVLLAAGLWMLAWALRPPIEGRVAGVGLTLFGVLYTAGLGVHTLWLRALPEGTWLLFLTLIATWASDTFAFAVGVRWGKRKLAPHISPGKSVEGVIGGFIGSAALIAVISRIFRPEVLGLGEVLLVGALLGIAAPVGDLVESVIKRNLKVKDASQVIPGHGGMLDRLDSILFTIPVAYYLFRILLPVE